jgi:hypothetical protein
MIGAECGLLALAMCWGPSQHVVKAGMAFLASCQPLRFTNGYSLTVWIYHQREQAKFSSSVARRRRGDCNRADIRAAAVSPSASPPRCGFQPAMVLAHVRACALSAMPGNRRRSSMAAENSPRFWNTARIAAASASVTTNCAGRRRPAGEAVYHAGGTGALAAEEHRRLRFRDLSATPPEA